MVSIFTLAALMIQRCAVIFYPMTIAMTSASWHTVVTLILVWMASASIAFPPLFGWSDYVPEASSIA